jgi:hypothetical protein
MDRAAGPSSNRGRDSNPKSKQLQTGNIHAEPASYAMVIADRFWRTQSEGTLNQPSRFSLLKRRELRADRMPEVDAIVIGS